MKKMIVIFENLEPVHLGKDVGALPLALQSNENWDVSLYSTFKQFTQSEYEKNVNLKFFTSFKNRKINKLLLFIDVLKNAKNINYLMVFHGGKDKYILFWLCKIFNKKLITYVKLDMGGGGKCKDNSSQIINRIIFQKNGTFTCKQVC